MIRRLPWLLGLVLACASDQTGVAVEAESEPESESESETETETGGPGDAQGEYDPCPADSCLCFASPIDIADDPTRWYRAAGDFNGDGLPDALSHPRNDEGEPAYRVYLGTGPFAYSENEVLGPAWPYEVEEIITGDFDGDGRTDLALLAGPAYEGCYLFFVPNDEIFSPNFIEHRTSLPFPGCTSNLTRAPLNDEPGDELLLVTPDANLIQVASFDPETAAFDSPMLLGTNHEPRSVHALRIDDDERLDLVSHDAGAQQLSIFIAQDDGYAAPQRVDLPPGISQLVTSPAHGLLLTQWTDRGVPHETDWQLLRMEYEQDSIVFTEAASLPSGIFGSNLFNLLYRVEGTEILVWSAFQRLSPVCPDGTGSWNTGPAFWDAGEGDHTDSFRIDDRDDDGRVDLLIREGISGAPYVTRSMVGREPG